MADVKLENVTFSYPNGYRAVENVNLEIKTGECVAIIGQNGAGKTTTVKMMNGLNKPTEGNVFIGSMNTRDHTTAEISRTVGYVFQNPDDQIFHSTVEAEIRYSPHAFKLPQEEEDRLVKKALEMTGLEEHKEKSPFDLPLSMRKFVTIAAVIAMNTDVLVFDEPTAGQDLQGNAVLSDILKQLQRDNKTIITISHDMEFVASNFRRVIVMADKHVISTGTPEEILWDDDVLEKARLKQPYAARVLKALDVSGQSTTIDGVVEAILG